MDPINKLAYSIQPCKGERGPDGDSPRSGDFLWHFSLRQCFFKQSHNWLLHCESKHAVSRCSDSAEVREVVERLSAFAAGGWLFAERVHAGLSQEALSTQ